MKKAMAIDRVHPRRDDRKRQIYLSFPMIPSPWPPCSLPPYLHTRILPCSCRVICIFSRIPGCKTPPAPRLSASACHDWLTSPDTDRPPERSSASGSLPVFPRSIQLRNPSFFSPSAFSARARPATRMTLPLFRAFILSLLHEKVKYFSV